MKILGIETSCDETAASIVEDGKKVLSSAIATSQELHIKTGGIIPEVAARKQVESIIPVIKKALLSAFPNFQTTNYMLLATKLDALSVVYGPGLIGSLLVGVETAKTLSLVWGKPLIPVNHLAAHIYANWITPVIPSEAEESQILRQAQDDMLPQFPAVALVVSGGHTDFVLMKSHGEIKYLGGTRDDAAGEAFDKTARLLGLPYPGGPAIASTAEKYLARHSGGWRPIESLALFPRPMLDTADLDMSFSGLKTSVLTYTKQNSNLDVNEVSANIQEAIVDTLVAKSVFAVEKYKPKSFLLAGGVSANTRLREKLTEAVKNKTKVFIPKPEYSTDNAAMVATAAFYNYKPVPWAEVAANPSLSIED